MENVLVCFSRMFCNS